jgi:hypothetical protein
VEELVERYGDHIEVLGSLLPDGMTIAVVGSVLEQVMEWLLGYESKGLCFNLIEWRRQIFQSFFTSSEYLHSPRLLVTSITFISRSHFSQTLGSTSYAF